MSDANLTSGPDGSRTSASEATSRPTSPVAIAIAWIIVLIPAAWGITQTAKTSAKLFQSPPAKTIQSSPGAAASH